MYIFPSLIFAKPNIKSFDFFDLIWAVGITDFVLKYFTIELKCLILFLPKMILAFKSRVRRQPSMFYITITVQSYSKYHLQFA